MSATDEQPKCMRLIVTAVYADGTSVVHDIPQPAEVTAGFRDLSLGTEDFYGGLFGERALEPDYTVIRSRTTGFGLAVVLGNGGARTAITPPPGDTQA